MSVKIRLPQAVSRRMRAAGVDKKDSLGVGISGGADSMVLLQTLSALGFRVTALHVNFGLRGSESEEDARFVRASCQARGIPCLVRDESAAEFAASNGCNIQAAARMIRYAWWHQLHEAGAIDWLATAHHLDDNIETLYQRLLRGTGFHGLTGIPPVRDYLVRPMLDLAAAEIRAYARDEGIPYREDSSNRSAKYLRNRIRQALIPVLDDLNPHHRQSMQQTLARLHAESAAWRSLSPLRVYTMGDAFRLTCPHDALPFLCEWLEGRGVPWPLAYEFLTGQSTCRVLVHDAWILSKEGLGEYAFFPVPDGQDVMLAGPGQYPVGAWLLTVEWVPAPVDPLSSLDSLTTFVAHTAIQWPLRIGSPKAGDRMRPFGMHGLSRKLHDMMRDAKWSPYRKSMAPVVRSETEVLWVPGLRVSELARIGPNDPGAWKLSCRPLFPPDPSAE